MRLTSVWLVQGVLDDRTNKGERVVADTFEEAAELAPEALRYGWGSFNLPEVRVESVTLLHQDVRVDG